MAGTLGVSAPRLLLLSVAVLVMLSAAVVTEDARQCYWCGPLAEQVHRSRRAPACDASANQLTTCDQGYNYCAIVATAPPYVESRYCVRTHHNDCHLLYCNTTRTWKMTCPCKENLCNGPNSERVSAAFADLRKMAEQHKVKRITKRTGQLVTLTKPRTEINLIITNTSDVQDNLLNGSFDEAYEQRKEQLTEIILIQESGNKAENMESDMESTEESITAENIEDTTEDIKMTEMEAEKEKTSAVVTSNEPVVTNEQVPTVPVVTNEQVLTVPVVTNEQVLTVPVVTNEQVPTVPVVSNEQILTVPVVANVQVPTVISRMDNMAKTREELPTAEALQQNASPVVSEKPMTPTTLKYETTTLITTEIIENVTKEPARRKNGSAQTTSSVFNSFIAYILVQFIAL